MKLKNFLTESAYWLGMIIALWLTVHSCAAQAQQRFSTPNAYHRVHPKTPDSGYVLYERNDSLFAMFSNGDEKYFNVDHGAYDSVKKNTRHFRATMREVYNTPDSALYVSTGMIEYQSPDTMKVFGWITDSITWVATDTTFTGDCKCEHEWVYSEDYSTTFRSVDLLYLKSNMVLVCADGHHPRTSLNYLRIKHESHDPNAHCPYEVNEREKICHKCLFSVIEREKWFQHFIAPPKSEFESLKEKQRAKQ